jgi:hypothetical protein
LQSIDAAIKNTFSYLQLPCITAWVQFRRIHYGYSVLALSHFSLFVWGNVAWA